MSRRQGTPATLEEASGPVPPARRCRVRRPQTPEEAAEGMEAQPTTSTSSGGAGGSAVSGSGRRKRRLPEGGSPMDVCPTPFTGRRTAGPGLVPGLRRFLFLLPLLGKERKERLPRPAASQKTAGASASTRLSSRPTRPPPTHPSAPWWPGWQTRCILRTKAQVGRARSSRLRRPGCQTADCGRYGRCCHWLAACLNAAPPASSPFCRPDGDKRRRGRPRLAARALAAAAERVQPAGHADGGAG